MSKREEKAWSLWCDWPGCDYQFEDEYSIFGDGWDADQIVTDHDGRVDRDGKRHYCHQHLVVWASDLEDGEALPSAPFLLIHDGDTGNSADDGLVSLHPATEGAES